MAGKKSKSLLLRFGYWILSRTVSRDISYSALGDFEEIYYGKIESKGFINAYFWFWIQVLKSLPSFIFDKITWGLVMFKNYFKITIRNIKKQKIYSFINLTGFAFGIACCLIILLFVRDELSYDRFHEKSDRIYRVGLKGRVGNNELFAPLSSALMAETLMRDYPDVIQAVRLFRPLDKESLVHYNNIRLNENRLFYADAAIFELFSFPLIEGNEKTALLNPNTMVITKSAAKKYFGKENPIGKVITVDNNTDYTVTGITEDVPYNSHFHFDFLASLVTLEISRTPVWLNNAFYTYLILRKNSSPLDLEAAFPGLIRKYIGPQIKAGLGVSMDEFLASGNGFEFFLQPLEDIHLHSHLRFELEENSDIKYIYIFSIIALFILIIACINYMNLSTARSSLRAKEVGIRKVLGSGRMRLIRQFQIESLILTFLAVLLALILTRFFVPVFEDFTGRHLSFDYFNSLKIIPGIIGIVLIIGMLAGGYPAFFLASFQPVGVLQRKKHKGSKGNSFIRNGLVVFQFIISVILIAGTIIIYNQLGYIREANLGFNKDQVFVINRASALGQNYYEFKQELLRYNDIINISSSNAVPGGNIGTAGLQIEGDSENTLYLPFWISADYDFFETFQIELKTGRYFSKEFSSDTFSIVLNESAVKDFGIKDPVGKRFKSGTTPFNIIGVMKDFHFESLHKAIQPAVVTLQFPGEERFGEYAKLKYISIRLKPENINRTITFINNKWEKFVPDQPFDYFFLDTYFDSLYMSEQRLGRLLTLFSVLAIIIGCLGLFGLTSYTAERRTKEIGIRKVLGASISNVILLLSKEFSKWLLISNIIAWPIAYYIMNKWLQNFAFRININILTFIFAGMIVFGIALFTIGFQTIKVAVSNPVDALKYE